MSQNLHTIELELPTEFTDRLRELDDKGLDGAIAEGLSSSAAAKRALDFYIEYAHAHSPEDVRTKLRRTGNKEERIARDARIVELADKGLTRAGIAVEVGLSAIRVSQIIAYERARKSAENA